jgi:hypothetical protein
VTAAVRRVARYCLLAAPLAAALAVAVVLVKDSDGDSDPDAAEVVAVDAAEPTFSTLDELLDASDLVISGEVVEVGDGRAITDPADAETGIRTRLASVDVDAVLAGEAPGSIVIEQEAALLDGTPIEVNGVPALSAGQVGIYFLVAGDSEEFPYFALVSRQARYDVVNDTLVTSSDDELSQRLASMPPAELERAITDAS